MKINKQNIADRNIGLLEKFLIWFIPLLLTLLQRAYGLTLKRVDIGKEKLDIIRKAKKPWIYGIWHTNVLFSPYFNRNQRVYTLVSNSKDGELIARVVRRFGNETIRGSSSKGGMRALREIISVLKKGHPVAITPDGPRGPALKLQDGIINAARHSGSPIVPFYYESTNQWVLHKSWDKHVIPKAFSTVVVSYGDPIYVDRYVNDETDALLRAEIESKFIANMEQCKDEVLRRSA